MDKRETYVFHHIGNKNHVVLLINMTTHCTVLMQVE